MVSAAMDIRKEFEQTVIVTQNECDLNCCMKLSALLRRVQQISTDHCTALNITEEDYVRTHSAFLLAKMSVILHSNIKVGENIRLLTHPGIAQKAVYPRFTEILHEDGSLAAEVDARWILVDTESRKIFRRAPEDLPIDFGNETVPLHDISIPKEKEAEPAGSERIGYSRTDLNRHLNNTEYADIICDHLPLEEMCEKAVERFVIHYHQEVKMGESVEIFRKNREEGWYVSGTVEAKNSFEALLKFRD